MAVAGRFPRLVDATHRRRRAARHSSAEHPLPHRVHGISGHRPRAARRDDVRHRRPLRRAGGRPARSGRCATRPCTSVRRAARSTRSCRRRREVWRASASNPNTSAGLSNGTWRRPGSPRPNWCRRSVSSSRCVRSRTTVRSPASKRRRRSPTTRWPRSVAVSARESPSGRSPSSSRPPCVSTAPTARRSRRSSARDRTGPSPMPDRRVARSLVVTWSCSTSVRSSTATTATSRGRSVSASRPTTQQRMLDVVTEAQAAGVAAVADGVAAAEVDRVCRDRIADAGWGEAFLHGTGPRRGARHPRGASGRRPRSDATLAAGHVVTVEPGVYLPEHGGVRVEDTLLVTPDGARALTRSPKHWTI